MINYSILILVNAGVDRDLPGEGPLLYRNLGFDNAPQLLYDAAWLTFALGLNRKSLQKLNHPCLPIHYIHF